MNAVMDSANSYADVVNRNSSTVPPASQFPFTPSSELRSVIREERNEQLTEIAEQKHRASNLVVHGIPEPADFKVKDRISIIRLLETIGVEPNYVSIDRLGKKDENLGSSKRPIKVVMRSAKDKDLVMANLIKLKGNKTFRGISITDDYTPKERQTRNEWVAKAKAANDAEPEQSMWIWREEDLQKTGCF